MTMTKVFLRDRRAREVQQLCGLRGVIENRINHLQKVLQKGDSEKAIRLLESSLALDINDVIEWADKQLDQREKEIDELWPEDGVPESFRDFPV